MTFTNGLLTLVYTPIQIKMGLFFIEGEGGWCAGTPVRVALGRWRQSQGSGAEPQAGVGLALREGVYGDLLLPSLCLTLLQNGSPTDPDQVAGWAIC